MQMIEVIYKYVKVAENKRLQGRMIIKACSFVLSQEHIDVEKRLCNFPVFCAVTEANIAIWKKKSGNYKATKDYSQ